jgi:hypothetical protein
MSGDREERIAHTEALFREVNERIAESVARFEGDTGDFVCECADPACTHRVSVPLDDYERVREDPTTFVLAVGHADESVEAVVEERAQFQVVEKRAPRVAAIVRRLDPRTA